MEVRPGHVRRVSGGLAWIDVERQSGCGRCAESGGCGRACERRAATYVIPVGQAVSVGEQVSISVPQRAPLVAALMSYGVAIAALFAGAFAARLLIGESDAAIAAGSFAGLCAAALWLRLACPRASILPAVTGPVDRTNQSMP